VIAPRQLRTDFNCPRESNVLVVRNPNALISQSCCQWRRKPCCAVRKGSMVGRWLLRAIEERGEPVAQRSMVPFWLPLASQTSVVRLPRWSITAGALFAS